MQLKEFLDNFNAKTNVVIADQENNVQYKGTIGSIPEQYKYFNIVLGTVIFLYGYMKITIDMRKTGVR